MKRIWHNYKKWEDLEMWRIVPKQEEKEFLKQAIEFTGNTDLYGQWMLKVILNWKYSCEHNLTNSSINQKAWVGHAATQMAIDCPEYITRMAWKELTQDQQDRANKKAETAIKLWNIYYAKANRKLDSNMETA